MPQIKTVITIDVEPDCDRNWKRRTPYSFSSLLVGLPILEAITRPLEIPIVFFLAPEILSDQAALSRLLKFHSFEIGTHLHAEYVPPEATLKIGDNVASYQFPCADVNDQLEREKIKNMTDRISDLTGQRTVSYRAARFGADINTIESLKVLGYKIDSSVTPHIDWQKQGGPDFSSFPEQPYFVSSSDFSQKSDRGLLEFPITIGPKRFPGLPARWYFYRWLRPNITTLFEQKNLIRQRMKRYGPDGTVYFNLMFHSNEMKDDCSPSLISARDFFKKLQSILSYLDSLGSDFNTLAQIYPDLI